MSIKSSINEHLSFHCGWYWAFFSNFLAGTSSSPLHTLHSLDFWPQELKILYILYRLSLSRSFTLTTPHPHSHTNTHTHTFFHAADCHSSSLDFPPPALCFSNTSQCRLQTPQLLVIPVKHGLSACPSSLRTRRGSEQIPDALPLTLTSQTHFCCFHTCFYQHANISDIILLLLFKF